MCPENKEGRGIYPRRSFPGSFHAPRLVRLIDTACPVPDGACLPRCASRAMLRRSSS